MSDSNRELALFAGNSNPRLATSIAKSIGVKLGKCSVSAFSDGEVNVDIVDNVRGKDVFIIQPTCPPGVNNNLMELLVMIDALRRSSAGRITAVVPYYGYARQDRRLRTARGAITAKLVANMIESAGANRMLTVDIHADQILGFFEIPFDNVYASQVLLGNVWTRNYANPIIVSPDVGGVTRARAFAKRLDDIDMAIIDKRRPKANVSQVMNIIGDVEGRTCILIDDMIDTAGTLCHAGQALIDKGAKKVVAYATHPIFSGEAITRITESVIDEVVVTDTIPLSEAASKCSKIKQLSIANLLAETIERIHEDRSVSSLYID